MIKKSRIRDEKAAEKRVKSHFFSAAMEVKICIVYVQAFGHGGIQIYVRDRVCVCIGGCIFDRSWEFVQIQIQGIDNLGNQGFRFRWELRRGWIKTGQFGSVDGIRIFYVYFFDFLIVQVNYLLFMDHITYSHTLRGKILNFQFMSKLVKFYDKISKI